MGELPSPSWFLHFLGTGEALPELVGEIERRPGLGSRAMIFGELRSGRNATVHVHLLYVGCADQM